MTLHIVSEQAHCSVAVPELQCGGLVLALPVGPLDFQHCVVGRQDEGDVATREGLLQLEAPLLRTFRDELRDPLLPCVV